MIIRIPNNDRRDPGVYTLNVIDESCHFLSGIQVLDLANGKASFCSKLLADMGARVIKVEKPGGDPARWIGPFYKNTPHPEESFSFWYNNNGKEGVTLDIENPVGRPLFFRMVEKTDVLVESFPPGTLSRVGAGFEILREKNPRLIVASITGFGQDGPRKRYKSCDLVASAFGGQMHLCGFPDSRPMRPFGEQSHYAASLFAVIAILLALRKRKRSGKGENIDISAQEAVAATLDHVMARYFNTGDVPGRQGNRNWDDSFVILPCKDGHILISLFQQWETLIEWMDSDGMAGDLKEVKWRQEEVRRASIDHVIAVMKNWTQTYATRELFEKGQLLRFPWAPIQSPEDVLACPHLQARDFFIAIKDPEEDRYFRFPRSPFWFQKGLAGEKMRAPSIGEHNTQVYQREMAISPEELQRLAGIGVI